MIRKDGLTSEQRARLNDLTQRIDTAIARLQASARGETHPDDWDAWERELGWK